MSPSSDGPRSLVTDDDPRYLDLGDRQLAYATYGDPNGRTVLFCHGTPGSRLLGRLLDAPAAERGVRLVAPETDTALSERLPEATPEQVDSDHLGTLCVAAPRALRGPTPV